MKTTGAETVANTDVAHSREAINALNLDLRESEQRYRTLFDLVPVAVYTIDSAGVIQNFNRRAAELWGREPALGYRRAVLRLVQIVSPGWQLHAPPGVPHGTGRERRVIGSP